MNKLKRKFLMSFQSGEKGFTLIELLVVISILGVLASVAVPNVASMLTAGNAAAANAEMATVQTAIQAAMTNANVATFSGPISSGASGTPTVAPYISGGLGTLKCVYIVNTDGSIASASTTLLAGIVWDPTLHQFKKP